MNFFNKKIASTILLAATFSQLTNASDFFYNGENHTAFLEDPDLGIKIAFKYQTENPKDALVSYQQEEKLLSESDIVGILPGEIEENLNNDMILKAVRTLNDRKNKKDEGIESVSVKLSNGIKFFFLGFFSNGQLEEVGLDYKKTLSSYYDIELSKIKWKNLQNEQEIYQNRQLNSNLDDKSSLDTGRLLDFMEMSMSQNTGFKRTQHSNKSQGGANHSEKKHNQNNSNAQNRIGFNLQMTGRDLVASGNGAMGFDNNQLDAFFNTQGEANNSSRAHQEEDEYFSIERTGVNENVTECLSRIYADHCATRKDIETNKLKSQETQLLSQNNLKIQLSQNNLESQKMHLLSKVRIEEMRSNERIEEIRSLSNERIEEMRSLSNVRIEEIHSNERIQEMNFILACKRLEIDAEQRCLQQSKKDAIELFIQKNSR